MSILQGAVVEIHSLVKSPQLNGLLAVVFKCKPASVCVQVLHQPTKVELSNSNVREIDTSQWNLPDAQRPTPETPDVTEDTSTKSLFSHPAAVARVGEGTINAAKRKLARAFDVQQTDLNTKLQAAMAVLDIMLSLRAAGLYFPIFDEVQKVVLPGGVLVGHQSRSHFSFCNVCNSFSPCQAETAFASTTANPEFALLPGERRCEVLKRCAIFYQSIGDIATTIRHIENATEADPRNASVRCRVLLFDLASSCSLLWQGCILFTSSGIAPFAVTGAQSCRVLPRNFWRVRKMCQILPIGPAA